MWTKSRVSILLLCIFMFVTSMPVQASEISMAASRGRKVIRVGFPDQEGLTEKTKDGEYDGYTVAYLEEVKKYTGWEYEYVEVEGSLNEQLVTLMEMLEKGEIDLLGGMLYNGALAEQYDYPSYSYGQAHTVLAVRADDNRWLENDYEHWNGMVIGTYPRYAEREENLQKYATVNGFEYELKEYETLADIMQAIYIGEVDATFQVDLSMENNLKAIGKFSPVPYYFATTKGNTELIQELSRAHSRIEAASPNIKTTLYNKYFSNKNHFTLSEENKEYIKSLGTINVLFIKGNAPIHYCDGENPLGISIDILEAFKKQSGLSYNLIMVDSYEEAIEKVNEGNIDLLLGVNSDSYIFSEIPLKFSIPYFESQKVLISNKKDLQPATKESDISYDIEKKIKYVNEHTGIGYYIDVYSVNYYLQKKGLYNNVLVNYNDQEEVQYCMAIPEDGSNSLLNIIDSFITNMTEDELQTFIYENMLVSTDYNIAELLKVYSLQISIIILVVIIIISTIYVNGVRKSARINNEMAFQYKKFDELTKLMNECFFSYDYAKDELEIHNNRVMFNRKNHIKNFINGNREYEFLNQMIENQVDDFHNFILNTAIGPRWYRIIIKIVKDEKGEVVSALGRIYDVHDDINDKRELMEKSQKDSLTGLFNRSTGEEKIGRLLDKNDSEGILLLLDLDNFKLVNDNLGHPIGDSLLKRVAKFIETSFTSDDIKCRLGGDEFLVYITETMSKDELEKRLCDFISEINLSVFYLYSQYNISMSIGAAFANDDTYTSLYEKADRAMYQSKHSGKNQFFIYEEK